MERNLSATECAAKLKIPHARLLAAFNAGEVPGERVNARKFAFNLEEVRKAWAQRDSSASIGSPAKATAHDEDDPNFDELENAEEEQLAEIEQEALEASREAIETVYLAHIQKCRGKKRRGLARKLLGKLTEVQQGFDEQDAAEEANEAQ